MLKLILIASLYSAFILMCAYISLKISDKRFCKRRGILPEYAILTVTAQEDAIEGSVRQIAKQMLYGKTIFTELLILDLSSSDNIKTILENLSKEYPFVHTTTRENYKTYIDNLS